MKTKKIILGLVALALVLPMTFVLTACRNGNGGAGVPTNVRIDDSITGMPILRFTTARTVIQNLTEQIAGNWHTYGYQIRYAENRYGIYYDFCGDRDFDAMIILPNAFDWWQLATSSVFPWCDNNSPTFVNDLPSGNLDLQIRRLERRVTTGSVDYRAGAWVSAGTWNR